MYMLMIFLFSRFSLCALSFNYLVSSESSLKKNTPSPRLFKVDFHCFLLYVRIQVTFTCVRKRGNINVKVEHRSVYVSARHIIHCLYFIDTRTFLARTYSTQNTSQFKFEDPLSPPVGHDSADD